VNGHIILRCGVAYSKEGGNQLLDIVGFDNSEIVEQDGISRL
jgi:hypothetical protein